MTVAPLVDILTIICQHTIWYTVTVFLVHWAMCNAMHHRENLLPHWYLAHEWDYKHSVHLSLTHLSALRATQHPTPVRPLIVSGPLFSGSLSWGGILVAAQLWLVEVNINYELKQVSFNRVTLPPVSSRWTCRLTSQIYPFLKPSLWRGSQDRCPSSPTPITTIAQLWKMSQSVFGWRSCSTASTSL